MAAYNKDAADKDTAGTEVVDVTADISQVDSDYKAGKEKLDQNVDPDFNVCLTAATENPILTKEDKVSGEYFNDNFSPFVNKHKIVHVRVGAGDYLNQMDPSQMDNWRKQSVNSLCDVDPHVVLISPNLDFAFSQSISYGKAMNPEEMTQKYAGSAGSGLLKKGSEMIDNAVSLAVAGGVASDKLMQAAGATYLAEYNNIKAFEGCSVTLPNSIQFDFAFGRYGLFDGRKEVVEPILALASIFGMQPLTMAGMYKGPVPTASWMKTQVMKQMKDVIKGSLDVSKVVDSAKAKFEDMKEQAAQVMSEGTMMQKATAAATKALEAAVNIKSKAYGAFNMVSQLALCQAGTRLLTFSIGKQVVGPLYVGSVNWNFDFNSVDQFGYPCSGTIQFGGLESPHVGSFRTVNTFRI